MAHIFREEHRRMLECVFRRSDWQFVEKLISTNC